MPIDESMYKRIYKLVSETFNEYELEVFLTDIWCLYQTHRYGLQYEKIVVTKGGGDKGVDAIVIPRKSEAYTGRKYYFLQISKSSKNCKNVFTKLEQAITLYREILGDDFCQDNLVKVVVTLKKTKGVGDIESISDQKLLNMIYEVGNRYNIITLMELDKKYVENVKIRTAIYNVLIKYINIDTDAFEVYIKFLINNYYLIQQSLFDLLVEHDLIMNRHLDNYLNSIPKQAQYRNVFKIIGKIGILNQKIINTWEEEIFELLVYLEPILENYKGVIELVPTDWYIALKAKIDATVIAYFSYEYGSKKGVGYNFSFRCEYKNLPSHLLFNDRIFSKQMLQLARETKSNEYRDNKNFNLDTNLKAPNLEADGELIKELIEIALRENGYI